MTLYERAINEIAQNDTWPVMQTAIAEAIGCSSGTVNDAVVHLAMLGLVERGGRGGLQPGPHAGASRMARRAVSAMPTAQIYIHKMVRHGL